jgi:hypothetical protein
LPRGTGGAGVGRRASAFFLTDRPSGRMSRRIAGNSTRESPVSPGERACPASREAERTFGQGERCGGRIPHRQRESPRKPAQLLESCPAPPELRREGHHTVFGTPPHGSLNWLSCCGQSGTRGAHRHLRSGYSPTQPPVP